jgi:hypothetical protein
MLLLRGCELEVYLDKLSAKLLPGVFPAGTVAFSGEEA